MLSPLFKDDTVPPSYVTFSALCHKQGAIRPIQWGSKACQIRPTQLTHQQLDHWRDNGDSLDKTCIVAARLMRFRMSHVSPILD
ncbi:hypothetical protein O181_086666 [Austropuccinia psidii MF-1]|uniref:Uncharacterized protein n=1 Tax=Austropuccinia psidii MF-1 TaxID=1389203 RepID=A0A9Q3G0A0_9BASI|nr:hypothetical protein [Austropuccinia psidii MF-1]